MTTLEVKSSEPGGTTATARLKCRSRYYSSGVKPDVNIQLQVPCCTYQIGKRMGKADELRASARSVSWSPIPCQEPSRGLLDLPPAPSQCELMSKRRPLEDQQGSRSGSGEPALILDDWKTSRNVALVRLALSFTYLFMCYPIAIMIMAHVMQAKCPDLHG